MVGAIYGHMWIQGEFPQSWLDKSIAIKELVPIYLSSQKWASKFHDTKILFLVDNMSIVKVLQKNSSKDSCIMAMVRKMVILGLKYNITFSAAHIRGKHNILSDMLSRFQTAKALQVAPWLDTAKTRVPDIYLPWSHRHRRC